MIFQRITVMKKYCFSHKTLFLVSVIILSAFLIPLLLAGAYAVPCADDYSYGYEAHKVFTETGSVFRALLRGLEHVGEVYAIWQGTYSAICLFSVQPAVFGESLYALTAVIMLLSLTAGCLFICKELFSGVFGLDGYVSGVIGCAVGILCTQLLPSPVQGFYWYNGAVYYTFFYGLSLIAFALGIKSIAGGKKCSAVWLCILCAILGGGNYVTALTCVIIGISAVLLLILRKDGRWKKLIIPTLILLLGFAVSVAAPGNSIRQSTVESSPGVLEAVLLSFAQCAEFSVKWFSLPLIGVIVLISPLLWNSVQGSAFSFRFPLLVTVYSYCLLSAMFCPPIYALGNYGEFRLLNIIFFAYVLLLVVNVFYWLGWIAKKCGKNAKTGNGISLLPVFGCSVCCLALVSVFILRGGSLCTVSALGILRNGEAKAFHSCAEKRLETLLDSSVSDAVLENYPSHPYLLYYDDISEDSSDWKNVDMASYYGKASVVLKIGQ